jgi:hypothetical protein
VFLKQFQTNKQFQEAASTYQNSPNQDNLSALSVLKEKMEQLYEKKVEGIIVRSRARWHEDEEKKFEMLFKFRKTKPYQQTLSRS